MIRKNIPDIVSCGSSVEDFEKYGKDYYAVISDLINQMTVTGLKMNLSYTSSKYHSKGRVQTFENLETITFCQTQYKYYRFKNSQSFRYLPPLK